MRADRSTAQAKTVTIAKDGGHFETVFILSLRCVPHHNPLQEGEGTAGRTRLDPEGRAEVPYLAHFALIYDLPVPHGLRR